MRLFLVTTFIGLMLLPQSSWALDDLQPRWNLDFLYHYTRIERATILSSENFISRQGGMLQFEYEEPFDLFWRWYVGGDITYAIYEASGATSLTPRERLPWQFYAGMGWQLGSLKNFEIFAGLGGSTEHYFSLSGTSNYTFEETRSLRAHGGFNWRFLSLVGTTVNLMFRYSLPVTPVDHAGTNLTYKGVLDGTIRLKPHYDSSWSVYGGIRFEDYETETKSVTYFTSRIFAGLGIHF